MRDAALSLALRHKFAGLLANPRQMEPYSYSKSSITMQDDEDFLKGPKPGSVIENFSFNDKFLSDMLDKGFNILWFGEKPKGYNQRYYPNLICLDPKSKIGELYGASNSSSYLIRPDMHILGRWYKTNLSTVLATYEKLLNGEKL
jgi:3-(3-hydroxy-phenyl)propionate hydroxylase